MVNVKLTNFKEDMKRQIEENKEEEKKEMMNEKEIQNIENMINMLIQITGFYTKRFYNQHINFEWNLKKGDKTPESLEFYKDGKTTRIIEFKELPDSLKRIGVQICEFSNYFFKETNGRVIIDLNDLKKINKARR